MQETKNNINIIDEIDENIFIFSLLFHNSNVVEQGLL